MVWFLLGSLLLPPATLECWTYIMDMRQNDALARAGAPEPQKWYIVGHSGTFGRGGGLGLGWVLSSEATAPNYKGSDRCSEQLMARFQ